MSEEFDKGYEAAKQASKEIVDKLTARIIDMEFEIQRANVVCENKDWSANNYVARAEKRIAILEAALKEVAVCLDGDRTGEDLLFAVRAARAALEKTND